MPRSDARPLLGLLRGDRWVRPFLRTHGRVLALAVLLSVAASVFAAALMFTSGYMISLAAAIPLTVLALHVPSIFVRIFGIGKPVLQYLERLTSHDWVLRMTSSLRRRFYEAVERRGESSPVGRTLGLFADDLENLQNLCLRTLFPMLVVAVVYVVTVVAFGVLSPLLGVLLLVVMGLAAFAVPFWSLAANAARVERRRGIQSGMYDTLSEDVLGVVDWGLSGRREDFLERLSVSYEAAYDASRRVQSFERRASVVRQGLYCAAVVAVLVWAAYAFFGSVGASADGFMVTDAAHALAGVTMHDSVPYAANWIAAFVLCMFPLFDVFTPASGAMLGLAEHRQALDELNGLDGEDAVAERVCAAAAVRREPCLSIANAVEVAGVACAFGEGDCVLSDVDLAAPKGARVAIMGRSGAGKTTLLDLVGARRSSMTGSVRVTGRVGYVEQFPYVFRKSLRENLLLAKPDATDGQIVAALHEVGLGDLLDRLPDGLDAFMAEGGATLSGGERHRLALARILLFDCDVVLLDEPYRALDVATQREVAEAMLRALRGKTVLMVTHSSDQAQMMDEVYVVEDGRLSLSKLGVASSETCV